MKRILLVPDVENWAWGHRAKSIRRYAPSWCRVDVVPQGGFKAHMADDYDGTLVFSWPDIGIQDDRVWTFVANEGCMYDFDPNSENHVRRTASLMKNRTTAKERIPKFRGVITINHRPLEFLKSLNPNTVYLSTGVDCEFFRPIEPIAKDGPFRVGWCGKAFDDPSQWTSKGWHEVMLPLMGRFSGDDRIEFVVNRRNANNALSQEEMLQWYNSIDLLLVTSCSEGTPSVAMEAMASGRPFVATNVGIIKEAASKAPLNHPCGAILPQWTNLDEAQATVEKMEAVLRSLTEQRGYVAEAGRMARRIMETHYHWKDLAPEWVETILK